MEKWFAVQYADELAVSTREDFILIIRLTFTFYTFVTSSSSWFFILIILVWVMNKWLAIQMPSQEVTYEYW